MSRQTAAIGPRDARQFVLATKITPPPNRPEHLARARLFDQLDVATTRPLTLISASIGFGKTTLLSEWARQRAGRTAWYTITASDADIVRLTAGIVASLRRAEALDDDDVDRDLIAPGIDVADLVLPRVLDAIRDDQPTTLVLDDYHLLSGPSAHRFVETLIADMSASLHVVIATRADPLLPLGRLRATGAMVEIRADQLRFDRDETDQFLNGSLGLDLDRGSLEILEARTEGWPAGLYLAALSLRDRSDRERFVSEFAGSSRHIVDYLSAEVLDGLDPDDRAFLLRSSILERLTGPVCDAVTGMTGSAARLRALERANLFIVPLDETRTWFRYHRLFAELLRSQLVEASADIVPELHRRAAAWHAGHGSMESAIEHALAADDRDLAGTLVARSWREFTRTGQFQTLQRLLDEIGDDRGPLTGPLAAVEAILAGMLGREPRVLERLLATAAASDWSGPTPDGRSIDAIASMVVASFAATDLDRQEAAARHLIDAYDAKTEPSRTGRAALGMILVLKGDPTGALEALRPIAEMPDIPQAEMFASAARALAVSDLGEPVRAESIARASLIRADGWAMGGSRVAGALWLALGSRDGPAGPASRGPAVARACARDLGCPGHAAPGADADRARVRLWGDRRAWQGARGGPRSAWGRRSEPGSRRLASAPRGDRATTADGGESGPS